MQKVTKVKDLFTQKVRKATALEKQILRLEDELDRKCNTVAMLVFPAFALSLYRDYGFKKRHVEGCLAAVRRTYDDVSGDDVSMIQLCKEETGIDVSDESEKTWEELTYLSSNRWDEWLKEHPNATQRQYQMYLLATRQRQLKWIEPTLYSSIFVAMHRREKFGFDRNTQLYANIKALTQQYKSNELIALCKAEIGLDLLIKDGQFLFGKEEEED